MLKKLLGKLNESWHRFWRLNVKIMIVSYGNDRYEIRVRGGDKYFRRSLERLGHRKWESSDSLWRRVELELELSNVGNYEIDMVVDGVVKSENAFHSRQNFIG